MLLHPVIQQLRTLKLDGMALALQEQQEQASIRELSFEERLTLLLERERVIRDTKGMPRRLSAARLKQNVSMEEVDVKHPRGLDAKLFRSLHSGQWIAEK
ncbi:ATP-binding protein, partial [Deinococcus sp. RIT780]